MSLPEEMTVPCKKCRAPLSFVAWQSLNATLNPVQKKQLLSGELTRLTCDQCGNSESVIYPLLYHDMRKRLMLWLWLNPGEPNARAMMLTGDYRFRRVATQNELIEKILIFDHGLDDQMVELLKLQLEAETRGALRGELRFTSLTKDSTGKEVLCFDFFARSGDESVLIAAPLESYRKIQSSYGLKFAKIPPDRWWQVDRNFVAAVLNEQRP